MVIIIVLDNSGLELISDLLLIEYLLKSYPSIVINLHVKQYPTFISDTTKWDLFHTLDTLLDSKEGYYITLGQAIMNFITQSRLVVLENPCWTYPILFDEISAYLPEIRTSDLFIFKGDANFRRLALDRLWPNSTPFSKVVGYFPTSVASFRTLKSELVVGIEEEKKKYAQNQDPHWMENGNWGTIQFVRKP